MPLLVGQEDWFVVEHLPKLAFADAVPPRLGSIPVVNLEIKDPGLHLPLQRLRHMLTSTNVYIAPHGRSNMSIDNESLRDDLQTLNEPIVEFFILADYAEAVNGKLYMMGGGWDQSFVKDFSQPVSFSFAIGIQVPW